MECRFLNAYSWHFIKRVTCLLSASLGLLLSHVLFAADNQPIEKKYDDRQIMDRVQLVGVIADSSASQAGIAVIKDAHTGKTYAIKAGDNLPGVGHIFLNRVQRQAAVFHADGKEYLVRLGFQAADESSSSKNETDESKDSSPSNSPESGNSEASGPGLFEKWANGVTEKNAALIPSEAIKNLEQKVERGPREALDNAPTLQNSKEIDDTENMVIEEDEVYE